MSDLERLKEIMGGIREADAPMGAPAHVETRLRAAFREQHSKRRSRPWFVWAAAAAAACIAVAAGLWRMTNPATVTAPPAPTAQVSPKSPAAPPQVAEPPTDPVTHASAPRTHSKAPKKAKPTARVAAEEIEFVALPFAPPFSPDDGGQVIRVRVPRQSIRSLGLPVNEERLADRVPAEILMGQDGIARGIRFVSASDVRQW